MVPTARILADRRLLASALGLLAVLNLIGLAVVFGPLRSRVQTLTQRATVATLTASTAARELATAKQTAAGSQKAANDLQRFYTQILPANQPAARQVTYVRLAQLARESNLSYDHRTFTHDDPEKDGVLARATLSMSVYGSYRDLRQFIYTLETAEEFVVIRQVGVTQGDDPKEPLEAALALSTFYKASDGR
jgi:hypothetical protein